MRDARRDSRADVRVVAEVCRILGYNGLLAVTEERGKYKGGLLLKREEEGGRERERGEERYREREGETGGTERGGKRGRGRERGQEGRGRGEIGGGREEREREGERVT